MEKAATRCQVAALLVRRIGLPPYVFGIADADWVVWRGGNEGFLGYPLLLLGQSLGSLRAQLDALDGK
jgi:hypothetical protein